MIKHTMIFNPAVRSGCIGDDGIGLTVVSEFLKHGQLVVKPNDGCAGQGVTLCHTIKETEAAILKLFRTHSSVSICPYYQIVTEYRTFYLDGKVHLIYGKGKPYVIGNGKATMGELIQELNLPDKTVVQENLKSIDMTYVPADGEKVEVSWKHNLSGGATPTVLEQGELYSRIEKLAIAAGTAMNVKFATIDIIETTDNELYVMEINSGIGATIFIETVDGGYEMVKEIFRKALKMMFQ